MKLQNGTLTRFAEGFGVIVGPCKNPFAQAADSLWSSQHAPLDSRHADVAVYRCKLRVPEHVGNVSIDRVLDANGRTGFYGGNACTPLQVSQILPAANQLEINGIDRLMGRPIIPGQLQREALRPFIDSGWNGATDWGCLSEIQALLQTTLPEDQTCTVMRVINMRAKSDRSKHLAPAITHGWLLVGQDNTLLFSKQTNPSEVSAKLLVRAISTLTHEHFEPELLVKVKDGAITHAASDVLEYLELQGRDLRALDLSHCADEHEEANTESPRM